MKILDFCLFSKKDIVEAILKELGGIRNIALASAEQAHGAATHTENVAESRYDTLGLEAAYLAHGQTQRVTECDVAIEAFRSLRDLSLGEDDEIAVGALVCLKSKDLIQYLFLGPDSGGVKIPFHGIEFMLVTSHSPVGKDLLGKRVGDEVILLTSGQKTVFKVEALL